MKMTASPPLLGDMPSPGLSEGRVAFWESGCDGGGRRETAAPLRDGAGPSVLPLAGAGGLREGSPGGGLGCPPQQCVDLGSLGEDSRNGSCPNKNRLLRRVWG